MGGGDLNLKKSWHPSTRANLEKVFLAEQEAEKEKKRLEEFQKEKNRERDAAEIRRLREAAGILKKAPERLDWMYSVSKNGSQEKIHIQTPLNSSLEASKNQKCVNTEKRWDVESKLREDPLFKIKKIEKKKSMNNIRRH